MKSTQERQPVAYITEVEGGVQKLTIQVKNGESKVKFDVDGTMIIPKIIKIEAEGKEYEVSVKTKAFIDSAKIFAQQNPELGEFIGVKQILENFKNVRPIYAEEIASALGYPPTDQQIIAFAKIINKINTDPEHAQYFTEIPGAKDFLTQLQDQHNLEPTFVTNNSPQNLEHILKKLDISNYPLVTAYGNINTKDFTDTRVVRFGVESKEKPSPTVTLLTLYKEIKQFCKNIENNTIENNLSPLTEPEIDVLVEEFVSAPHWYVGDSADRISQDGSLVQGSDQDLVTNLNRVFKGEKKGDIKANSGFENTQRFLTEDSLEKDAQKTIVSQLRKIYAVKFTKNDAGEKVERKSSLTARFMRTLCDKIESGNYPQFNFLHIKKDLETPLVEIAPDGSTVARVRDFTQVGIESVAQPTT